jgi:predicted  nucleic acid-binding Zn-ribbon protein
MEANMNIDLRKHEMLLQLQKLRKECETLIERTHTYREDLLKVKTEEEAKQFDETHDLEEGLEIIRLF